MKVEYEDLTIEQAKSALRSGEKVQERDKKTRWAMIFHPHDINDTFEYRRVTELKEEFNPAVGETVLASGLFPNHPSHPVLMEYRAEVDGRFICSAYNGNLSIWDHIAPIGGEKPLTDIEKAIEELERASTETRERYVRDKIWIAIQHLKRAQDK